ncbi:MAG TPA: hypothetical protein VN229_05305 [Terriglobales bacterium]|nr:hypothetical protein [Terriglobales bacterium]
MRLRHRRSPVSEAVFVTVIAVLPAWLLTHLDLFDSDIELPPRHLLRLFGTSITGISLVGIFAWLLGHLSGLLIRPLVFAGLQLLVGFINHELALQQLGDLSSTATSGTVETVYVMQPMIPTWLVLGILVFLTTLAGELLWRRFFARSGI